jgi:hypothetical protein
MPSMVFLPMLIPHRVVVMVLIVTSRIGRMRRGGGGARRIMTQRGRCMRMMVVIPPPGGECGVLRWRELGVTIRLPRGVVCVLLKVLVVMHSS